MAEENHERFEELALGHVLGGLPSADAAAFRAHLVECRDCRLRVAELRDIAADLAATEREEKRLAAVATQVAEREEEDEENPPAPQWTRSRWIPVLAVVAIVGVLGILFWNYHMRRVTGQYASVVDRQEEVLSILSSGDPLEIETDRGVTAVAAVADGAVAISATDLPAEVGRGYIVIWRMDDGEVIGDPIGGPTSDPAAFVVSPDGADEVLVTGHRAGQAAPSEPGDAPLVRVDTSPGD